MYKSSDEFDFPWPIYMSFEMRFDLGTLDSGERSLPFGLVVLHRLHYLTVTDTNKSDHNQILSSIFNGGQLT